MTTVIYVELAGLVLDFSQGFILDESVQASSDEQEIDPVDPNDRLR